MNYAFLGFFEGCLYYLPPPSALGQDWMGATVLFIGDADMTLSLIRHYRSTGTALGCLTCLHTFISLVKIWTTGLEPEIYKNIRKSSYLQVKPPKLYAVKASRNVSQEQRGNSTFLFLVARGPPPLLSRDH